MGPMFTSEDIAALVANFQPLSVIEDRPLLVRSRSGNGLTRFDNVLARCKALIDQEEDRIEKSNLTAILGVEHGIERRILNDLDDRPKENRDGLYILPNPIIKKLHAELSRRVQLSCLDLRAFTKEQDVSLESLERLIQSGSNDDWRLFEENGRKFLCSSQVTESIKSELRQAIGAAGTNICDLPAALSDEVPLTVLKNLAGELAAEIGGQIRPEGGHVICVPANYSAAVEQRLNEIRRARIVELVQHLDAEGYCIIEPEAASNGQIGTQAEAELDQAVLEQFQQHHAKEPAPQVMIVSGDRSRHKTVGSWPAHAVTLIITPSRLEAQIEDQKSSLRSYTNSVWHVGPRAPTAESIINNLKHEDLGQGRHWKLARLLAMGEHVEELNDAVRERVQAIDQEEHQKLVQLVEARLLVPLQLYSSGIETIKDATLKQHLEEHILGHFRHDVVPLMLKAAQEQHLLRERSRERDMEKFRAAAADSKKFPDLQASVAKLQKKLKIETASEETVKNVKYRTLRTALKSMIHMTRGSDVLQNVIWIMLARHSDGLFMSPGKDVSRMIKQYENVGDAEPARRLSQWRDALKSGQQNQDEHKAMRELAIRAVEELSPLLRRKSSTSSQHSTARWSGTKSETISGRKSSHATEDIGNSAPPTDWQP